MLAIHSDMSPWSERWISYCDEKDIEYQPVNIYDSDIIERLSGDGIHTLVANPVLYDHRTGLIARSILYLIEGMGIRTFPNFEAFWHYNDKISQKYIFESLDIPHAPAHVFYRKEDALNWLAGASFPQVFKLRSGAGSSNVFLLKNRREAERYVRKMFGPGFKPVRPVFTDFSTRAKVHSKKRDWGRTLLNAPSTVRNIMRMRRILPVERGYFYVQEFLPGNDFDTRVFVMGNKAIASRRFVRENDFRASGNASLHSDVNQEKIDKKAVALAFDAVKKIGAYSMAFDIIYNSRQEPVIIEMSYTMPTCDEKLLSIEGYWDDSLQLQRTRVRCEDLILDYILHTMN